MQSHRRVAIQFPKAPPGTCRYCGRRCMPRRRAHDECHRVYQESSGHRAAMLERRGGAEKVLCVDRLESRCEGPIQSDHVRELADYGDPAWTVPRCQKHHTEKSRKAAAARRERAKGKSMGKGSSGGKSGDEWDTLIYIGMAMAAVYGVTQSGILTRAKDKVLSWVPDVSGVDVSAPAAPSLGSLNLWPLVVGVLAIVTVVAWRKARARALARLTEALARATYTDPSEIVVRVGLTTSRGSCHYTPAFNDAPGSADRARVEDVLNRKVGRDVAIVWTPHRDTVKWSPRRGDVEPEAPLMEAAPERPADGVVTRIREALIHQVPRDAPLDVEAVESDRHGPTVIRVRYPASIRDDAPDTRAVWQDRIAAKVPEHRWRPSWDTGGNTLTLIRRPPMPARVDLATPGDTSDTFRLPIGVDEHSDPVFWNMAVNPHSLIAGATGSGKALALDTAVPTPTGWTTMGALRDGDTVYDETGATCTVVKAHDVMHGRPCYEVEFSDGTVVVADAEHLWLTETRDARVLRARSPRWKNVPRYAPSDAASILAADARVQSVPDVQVTTREVIEDLGARWEPLVRVHARNVGPDGTARRTANRSTPGQQPHTTTIVAPTYSAHRLYKALAVAVTATVNQSRRDGRAEVVTTEQIAATIRTDTGHANHSIPLAGALTGTARDLPLDPYVLGVWLGDGWSYGGQVYTADREIISEIEAAGFTVSETADPYGYGIKGLYRPLREMGLLRNKHIPREYMHADVDTRRALLAGLVDTDGSINRSGYVEIGLTREALARDVEELALSLGHLVTVNPVPCAGRTPQTSVNYRIRFTPASTDGLSRLPRKAVRLVDRAADSRARRRYIVDVRPVESVPVRCITVDSPNRLFLVTKSLIATHNTVALSRIIIEAAARGFDLVLVDGKGSALAGFRQWPGVVKYGMAEGRDMNEALVWAENEMRRRYRLVTDEGHDPKTFRPILVVADEFTEVMGLMKKWWVKEGAMENGEENDRGKVVKSPLKEPPGVDSWSSIARLGREARVHIVVGIQQAAASIFGSTESRDQLGFRVVCGPTTPQSATMVFGRSDVGRDVPDDAKGRATIQPKPGGDGVEVQVYWTPSPRPHGAPPDDEGDAAALRRYRDACPRAVAGAGLPRAESPTPEPPPPATETAERAYVSRHAPTAVAVEDPPRAAVPSGRWMSRRVEAVNDGDYIRDEDVVARVTADIDYNEDGDVLLDVSIIDGSDGEREEQWALDPSAEVEVLRY